MPRRHRAVFHGTLLLLGALLGAWTASCAGLHVAAQGTLSAQVLQLLTRVNTWTNTNTFYDLRLNPGIPSVTTNRIYADAMGNLYYSGVLVADSGGAIGPHNLLSTTHPDTLAASVLRGALIVGNATPAWSRLTVGGAGTFLQTNGTDVSWSTNGSTLTALSSAALTGALPALDASALTTLNATQLTSGTVPLARLANIGFAQWNQTECPNTAVPRVSGAFWTCYVTVIGTVSSVDLTMPGIFTVSGNPVTTTGTLAVALATQTANTVWAGPTGGGALAPAFRVLVNADLPLSGVAAATYAKVTVNTRGVVTAASAQITLTTDVTGTLPMANGGTGVAVSADDTLLVGSGAAWVAQTLPNCPTPGALGYTQATNLFNCVATGGPTHAVLSATHTDTLAAGVARGDLVVGNATPLWSRFAIGSAGQLLAVSGGTDPAWSNTVARGTATAAGTGVPWTWTQTWNDAGIPFYGQVIAITNTASSAGNALLRLQAGAAGATLEWAVDASGNVQQRGGLSLNLRTTWSATAPTISSGFGGSPSIASNNGTAAFTIDVGTGGAASTGVIGLPTATTGWYVHCDDVTTKSSTVFVTKQTTTSATTATLGNYDATGAAAAWAASDILVCSAVAY